MAILNRPGGVEIHWEEDGDGPLVVISSYWSMHPSSFEPLTRELRDDHRVVTYHDRGTGSSSRCGPYDLETSAADLEAVIQAGGGGAVVVATADGCNRAVRVTARRRDLARAVVTIGGAPVARPALADSDGMIGSETVVEAFLELAGTDYRSALRGVMAATNPQLDEGGLRDRVAAQVAHAPAESAVPRLRAWADDDATADARRAGDRLWFLMAPGLGGGWFPDGADYERMIRASLPEARLETVDDGFITRPDQTAAVVRRITSAALEPA
jgi:pimeloyl-ACP methyl ester carboxylesterase